MTYQQQKWRANINDIRFHHHKSEGHKGWAPIMYVVDRLYKILVLYDIFNCNWVATRWQLFSTHIHTQTIQGTSQNKQYIEQHKKYLEQHYNSEECGPCPVFAGFTLAFALQLRKNHGKTWARVEKPQSGYWKFVATSNRTIITEECGHNDV